MNGWMNAWDSKLTRLSGIASRPDISRQIWKKKISNYGGVVFFYFNYSLFVGGEREGGSVCDWLISDSLFFPFFLTGEE